MIASEAGARGRILVDRLELGARRVLPAVVRITAGLLWLVNVDWKVPPDFGRAAGRGLARFINLGIEHPVLAPYSWVLDHVVRPHLEVFGWMTLVVEAALAALLLSGTFTRIAALAGAGQSAAIALTVMNAPGEWYWSYLLMIALHLAIFAMNAGRVWGVDAILAKRRGGGAAETGEFERSVRRSRMAVASALAAYGLVVVALQADHPFLTASYPNSGLALFRGTVAMGVLFVALAAIVGATAGRRGSGTVGMGLLALAFALFVTYRAPVNVLSATPSSAAILVATGAFLLASRPGGHSTGQSPLNRQSGGRTSSERLRAPQDS